MCHLRNIKSKLSFVKPKMDKKVHFFFTELFYCYKNKDGEHLFVKLIYSSLGIFNAHISFGSC